MLQQYSAWLRGADWQALLRNQWVHAVVLIPVGLFAFFQNLGISLFEGSEGLYAHITREMVQRGDYVHLTYQGEPYTNKSPFFFWTLALSTALWGETEVALRLPGSLFSTGTMALTYALGTMLFSKTAAFWAALVVATTHVFLWYGRRVLFDSMLTFFITLALFCWARAYFQKAGDYWYALSFIPMALATMTKGLHGFALPLLVIVSFLIIQRDLEPLRTRSFWIGLLFSLVILIGYAWALDLKWRGHTMLGMGPLISLTAPSPTGHPLYWYLGIMWFDFFPWAAMIPVCATVLLAQGPSGRDGRQVFVSVWLVGFFVMLSLSPLKREPYLIPMVPALGLLVGYACQEASQFSAEHRVSSRVLSLMLVILGLAYIVAAVIGPAWLHRKWAIPLTLFPLGFTVLLIGLGLTLLYAAIRMNPPLAFATLAISSLVFMVGVVQIILPGIDATGSARAASRAIKMLAKQSQEPLQLYSYGWPRNEDLIYYLAVEPTVPRISSEQSLLEAVHETERVLFLADSVYLTKLREREDLKLEVLQEFPQRRNKGLYLLLAQRSRSPH